MNVLLHIDRKDYDPSLPRIVSHSAKSIILIDDKVAMIYAGKWLLYEFPGGHIEDGESLIDTLIRETEEEAGLIVKPSTIVEFGKLVEIRKDMYSEGIYERHDYFFRCDVEDISTAPHLTKEEIDYGHQFVFVSINEAIAVNQLHMQQGFTWTEGTTHILNLLKT